MTSITGTIHYRPFIITKQAEWKALRGLDPSVYQRVTPVYVVAPRDWDYDNNRPKKSLDDHVAKVAREIAGTPVVSSAYIDVSLIEDDGPLVGGEAPITYLLREASAAKVSAMPMVECGSSTLTTTAAAAALTSGADGVAIRLAIPEWPSSNPVPLTDLMTRLGVSPNKVDLFLDAADNLGPFAVRPVVDAVKYVSAHTFRSVTFTGSAWPKTPPSGVGNHEIPRTDFTTFRDVAGQCNLEGLPVPDYADWTIAHPDPKLDVDPKMLNIAASFRYPAEAKWVFGKGELFKGNGGRGKGGAAVPPMLNALASHPEFGAVVPASTEDWVNDARLGRTSTGNATTWRHWGLLRHVELTVHQLASLP